MSYTASIYDPAVSQNYDITSRLKSLSTGYALDNEVSSVSFTCQDIDLCHLFNDFTLNKDGVTKFKGKIQSQEDSDQGYKETRFEAVDFGWLLQKRIAIERYVSKTPDYIIKDLITKYVPELTANNVDACGTVLEKLDCLYVNVDKVMSDLMSMLSGWHWYIDETLDIHFFYTYETDGPSFQKDIITGKYNFWLDSLQVKYEGYGHANRVWIVGRKQASSNFIHEYYTGDGIRRYFPLSYEPNETEVYVGGILKDSSLEVNDNGSRDFLINKTDRVIYIPSYKALYSTGANGIDIKYKPTIQFVDKNENQSDIAKFGLYEKVIKNQDVKDRVAARQYGKAEVRKGTQIRRIVYFNTQQEVKLGQRCRVNVAEPALHWNIVGYFLVTSVKREVIDGGKFEYINVGMEELL